MSNKEWEQKMKAHKAAEDELIAKIAIFGSDELFKAVEKWKRAGDEFRSFADGIELVPKKSVPKDYTDIKKAGAFIGIVCLFTFFACGFAQVFNGNWIIGLKIVGVIAAGIFILFLAICFIALCDYFFNG